MNANTLTSMPTPTTSCGATAADWVSAGANVALVALAVYGVIKWRADRRRETDHASAMTFLRTAGSVLETMARLRLAVPWVHARPEDQLKDWDERRTEVRALKSQLAQEWRTLSLFSPEATVDKVQPILLLLDEWDKAARADRSLVSQHGTGQNRTPENAGTLLSPHDDSEDLFGSRLYQAVRAACDYLRAKGRLL